MQKILTIIATEPPHLGRTIEDNQQLYGGGQAAMRIVDVLEAGGCGE
ncbi:hypothetical protein Q7I37_01680 [Aeromonas allosaccharophila]